MTEDEAKTKECPKYSKLHVLIFPDGEVREYLAIRNCTASDCALWVKTYRENNAAGPPLHVDGGHCGLIRHD